MLCITCIALDNWHCLHHWTVRTGVRRSWETFQCRMFVNWYKLYWFLIAVAMMTIWKELSLRQNAWQPIQLNYHWWKRWFCAGKVCMNSLFVFSIFIQMTSFEQIYLHIQNMVWTAMKEENWNFSRMAHCSHWAITPCSRCSGLVLENCCWRFAVYRCAASTAICRPFSTQSSMICSVIIYSGWVASK